MTADHRPSGRAGRARERAENLARRADKCHRQHRPDGLDALWARAADGSAGACESLAGVHERLAKANSGDVAEHCRRVTDYRPAAMLFRVAAAAFRADG